jgi:hypothetical protein
MPPYASTAAHFDAETISTYRRGDIVEWKPNPDEPGVEATYLGRVLKSGKALIQVEHAPEPRPIERVPFTQIRNLSWD